MDKFSVDFETLTNKVSGPKKYLLKDVENRIEKVAFDVVRFVDNDNINNLWQIKTMDDGQEYIVAMYDVDSSENSTTEKSGSDWSVDLNKKASYASVYYKGTPVTKFSLSSVGIPADEAGLLCKYLPAKLQDNSKLATSLLSTVPADVRKVLFELHPELKK